MKPILGQVVYSFFEDHLRMQKGLRTASIRSYRDTLRLFLGFVSREAKQTISGLSLETLTSDRVIAFLNQLEKDRGNHVRSRNQRRAALRTFFEYIAGRVPEMLYTCQKVAAIPVKRTLPPETHYLGDKWRACPLWTETAKHLQVLLHGYGKSLTNDDYVFCSRLGVPLTRFGVYKIVRRHAGNFDTKGIHQRRVTPHLFRHMATVHLLESGVGVNVVRGWLGHASLDTTNRYAELTLRAKESALQKCEPNFEVSAGSRHRPIWKEDASLLSWLNSL